ncbi:MAG TPA: amidase family protein, partial [Polyangiales bacterium]
TLGALPTAEVAGALEQTARLCRELGHELREVDAPQVDRAACADAFFTLAGAGMDQLMRMMSPLLGREPGPDELEPFTLALRARYRALPEGALARAQRAVAEAGEQVRGFLSEHDIVLSPTMPFSAPALGSLAPDLPCELLIERTQLLAGYTALLTFAGAPAMSVPLFESPEGLPIGSQFAARPGAEGTLLSLAYQLELARPWAGRWPAIAIST